MNWSNIYQIINLSPFPIMEGYNFEFAELFKILIAFSKVWA